MKKKMLVAVLVMVSAASVFASGNKDSDDTPYYGRGPAMGGMYGGGPGRGGYGPGMVWSDENGNPITPEEVTVEGALVLEEGTMPYLNTDGGKVFLMVPPFVWDEVDLKGGELVKATGYDVPEDRWGNTAESRFLHVVSAEVDGKTLTVDQGMMGYGGRGGRAPRGGMPGRGGW